MQYTHFKIIPDRTAASLPPLHPSPLAYPQPSLKHHSLTYPEPSPPILDIFIYPSIHPYCIEI